MAGTRHGSPDVELFALYNIGLKNHTDFHLNTVTHGLVDVFLKSH